MIWKLAMSILLLSLALVLTADFGSPDLRLPLMAGLGLVLGYHRAVTDPDGRWSWWRLRLPAGGRDHVVWSLWGVRMGRPLPLRLRGAGASRRTPAAWTAELMPVVLLRPLRMLTRAAPTQAPGGGRRRR